MVWLFWVRAQNFIFTSNLLSVISSIHGELFIWMFSLEVRITLVKSSYYFYRKFVLVKSKVLISFSISSKISSGGRTVNLKYFENLISTESLDVHWNIWNLKYFEFEIFRVWNIWNLKYFKFEIFEIWNTSSLKYVKFEIFQVRCSVFELSFDQLKLYIKMSLWYDLCA